MKQLEPVLLLLAAMVVLFTILLFAAEKWFPNDGQIFQVISGLLTGFGGALLMRVKPPTKPGDDPIPVVVPATTPEEPK